MIADALTGKMFFLTEANFFISFKCPQIVETRRPKSSTVITLLVSFRKNAWQTFLLHVL